VSHIDGPTVADPSFPLPPSVFSMVVALQVLSAGNSLTDMLQLVCESSGPQVNLWLWGHSPFGHRSARGAAPVPTVDSSASPIVATERVAEGSVEEPVAEVTETPAPQPAVEGQPLVAQESSDAAAAATAAAAAAAAAAALQQALSGGAKPTGAVSVVEAMSEYLQVCPHGPYPPQL
jgi:hypothetical protein